MTKLVKSLLNHIAFLRREFFSFEGRLERIIYMRIFPQLHNERDYGYPFNSAAELEMTVQRQQRGIVADLKQIEKQCATMPAAYGAALRHIMYQDINTVLAQYRDLASRRISPNCDPRLVATVA